MPIGVITVVSNKLYFIVDYSGTSETLYWLIMIASRRCVGLLYRAKSIYPS